MEWKREWQNTEREKTSWRWRRWWNELTTTCSQSERVSGWKGRWCLMEHQARCPTKINRDLDEGMRKLLCEWKRFSAINVLSEKGWFSSFQWLIVRHCMGVTAGCVSAISLWWRWWCFFSPVVWLMISSIQPTLRIGPECQRSGVRFWTEEWDRWQANK